MKLSFDTNFLRHNVSEKYLATIMPALKEKKVQSFTTLVFTLLAISFFGIFAISPTATTIVDLQKQISDDRFVDNQLAVKISHLSQLQGQFQTIQSQLPVVYAAVPTDPALATFVGQLQTLGTSGHVKVDNIQTLPVDLTQSSLSGKYNTFVFAINVEGNYADVADFLSAIIGFNRLLVVDSISVQKAASVEGYRINIQGRSFFKTQ
ncbi:MAG TPA: type 4a pilus biogenesis protein PilO [Patescibacteria group bacterium]|nr:type 4a pilus biogenesis protein PilO [Patescibacteria group bacterium]